MLYSPSTILKIYQHQPPPCAPQLLRALRARGFPTTKELEGVVLVVPVALVSSENDVDGLMGAAFEEIQCKTSEVCIVHKNGQYIYIYVCIYHLYVYIYVCIYINIYIYICEQGPPPPPTPARWFPPPVAGKGGFSQQPSHGVCSLYSAYNAYVSIIRMDILHVVRYK